MKTLYRYTSRNMSGWQFVLVQDNGTDGTITTGNTAATSVNTSSYDLRVTVATKKELNEIVARLDWLGKYSNLGDK